MMHHARFFTDIERLLEKLYAADLHQDVRRRTLLLGWLEYVNSIAVLRTSMVSITSTSTVTVSSAPILGGSGDTVIDLICTASLG
jgi:hypothetical protein